MSNQAKEATYLQRILPAEAFVAMKTGERLNSQMNPLMPLEIVVPVEALRTYVALKGSVVRLRWGMAHEVWHAALMRGVRCVSTVEPCHHACVDSANQSQLSVRVVDVGEDGCRGEVRPVRALISMR